MRVVVALAFGAMLFVAPEVRAQGRLEPLDKAVCRLIENAAHANRLPVGFLTRIIWRESSFRSGAVSPVGAEGIAQFMPETALARGVANPFDPEEAIPKAARLLAELRQRFGNLERAAAAYNAGAGRVTSWLQGRGELPAETRAYIEYITEGGLAEPAVAAPEHDAAATQKRADESCLAVAADLRRDAGSEVAAAPFAPWGVQLAGNFSKSLALAEFARAERRYAPVIGEQQPMIIGRLLRSRGTRRFYQVRLPAPTRAAANQLCGRIQAAGGACVALRS